MASWRAGAESDITKSSVMQRPHISKAYWLRKVAQPKDMCPTHLVQHSQVARNVTNPPDHTPKYKCSSNPLSLSGTALQRPHG